MRHLSTKGAVAACALFLVPTLAAAEDLTIVSAVTVGKGSPATTTTQYLTADKVRVSEGDKDTIFETSTGRMVLIDHRKKEYYEITREEMNAAFQQVEQGMQAAGPFLEKMMGGKMGEVSIQKAGPSRKVAGYDCDPYTASMGESLKYELCAAPSLPAPAQYFDALKAPYAMMGPMARRFEKTFEEMKKIKGFPLELNSSVSLMMMKQEIRSQATEVRKGPLPASAFEAPAGYKNKGSPFKSMRK